MSSSSDPRARAERAMQIAAERGWLDPTRVEAVLRLNAAWGKDAIECALEASWISVDHAAQLRAQLGAPSPPLVTPTTPTTGQQVGAYELERALGTGSMGTVFVGRHLHTQARHAIKLVTFGATPADSRVVQRFLREGQALARLSHPGVVKVHSCEHLPESGLGLLALELVDGSTLSDWLTLQELSVEAVVDLGLQLAEVLVHIHAAGIIHRDLKPENMLIRAEDARLVVCDFGVARDQQADSLTHTGQLLGSPAYMAPEQISGDRHAIGPATDVYAWAVTLYRLVSNRLPFDAPSLVELASHIVSSTPTPLRQHRPDVPPALEELISAGLAKSPSQRPSAAALVEALRDIDLEPGWRRARWQLPVFAALALTTGAIGAAFLARRAAPPTPSPIDAPSPSPSPTPSVNDPRATWAEIEALPPRARYPAIGAWLAQNADHPLAPRAASSQRMLLQEPLWKLRIEVAHQVEFLDERRLLIAAKHKAFVWDLPSKRGHRVRAPGPFRRLALSGDRSRFAVSCEGPTGQVAVHAARTREVLRTFKGHTIAVALDRSGGRVAIGEKDRVVVRSVETGERLALIPVSPQAPVRVLRFMPNGDLLVAAGRASDQNTLSRWTPRAEQVWTTDLGERPSALLALPDGQLLVGTSAANLSLFAASDGKLTGRLNGTFKGFRARQAHAGNVAAACLVPGRPWVLTASSGGRARHASYPPNDLRAWDPVTRERLHTWRPHRRDLYRGIASAPRGDVIAITCPRAETVEVWLTDVLVNHD